MCKVCGEGAGAVCADCTTRITRIEAGEVPSYIPLETVDVRAVFPTYVSGAVAVSLDGKMRGITVDDARHVANHLLAERVTLQPLQAQ